MRHASPEGGTEDRARETPAVRRATRRVPPRAGAFLRPRPLAFLLLGVGAGALLAYFLRPQP